VLFAVKQSNHNTAPGQNGVMVTGFEKAQRERQGGNSNGLAIGSKGTEHGSSIIP
jgi:hypothetical protein